MFFDDDAYEGAIVFPGSVEETEPTQTEQELYSALFPLIDRTYMIKDTFNRHVNDPVLLSKLPPAYQNLAQEIENKMDDLYKLLGLMLFEDNEDEELH